MGGSDAHAEEVVFDGAGGAGEDERGEDNDGGAERRPLGNDWHSLFSSAISG